MLKRVLVVAGLLALVPVHEPAAVAQTAPAATSSNWGIYPALVNNGYWYGGANELYWRYSWSRPGQVLLMSQYDARGALKQQVTLTRDSNGLLRRSDSPNAVTRITGGRAITQSANGFSEYAMQPGGQEFRVTFYPANGGQPTVSSYRRVSDAEYRRLSANAPSASPQEILTPLTREFLIGRWTDNGNCAEHVVFKYDGTFRLSSGVTGRWTLTGDQLSFIGERTVRTRARAVGSDKMRLDHPNGDTGYSTRCPA